MKTLITTPKTLRTITYTGLLLLLLIIISCGKEEDTILGNYRITSWELTSCRLTANQQTGLLSDGGVCVTWADDDSYSCLNHSFQLNEDLTFVYDLESETFDVSGSGDGPHISQSIGTYVISENTLSLSLDGKVVRTMTIDEDGSIFRATKSVTLCDTREVYRKI